MGNQAVACVVVGAGLAGLTAAHDLTLRGVDVVVLESRDRVGGRLVTRTTPTGERVELGGQWINPGHDRMFELVDSVGLELAPASTGAAAAVIGGAPQRLGAAPSPDDHALTPFEVADLGQGLLRFRHLSQRVASDDAWAQANATWLGQPLARWARSNLRTAGGQQAFRTVISKALDHASDEVEVGVALTRLAGRDLESLAVVNGGMAQRRVAGGVAAVCERLASQLGDRVQLDSAVTTIDRQPGQIIVTTSDGETFTCRDVIVAVPPRLVEGIRFVPELPEWRGEVAAGVPDGNVIKAALVYETPWWRERGMSGQVGTESGPMRVMSDTSDPGSPRGVLTGYFEGPEASGIGRWSSTLRQRAFTDAVERVFGSDVPAPLHYLELDWGVEEYTGGCHGAHFAPSVWTAVASTLSASEGHIHFAGAEYSNRFTGYMEGAVRSGHDTAATVAKSLAH